LKTAALYDVHGMAHALEAVLAEVERERFDAIVFGGDIVAGPFPHETLERIRGLDDTHFIRGNADRSYAVTPASEWRAGMLSDDEKAWLDALPFSLVLDGALYVHSTPRSDEEMVTERTSDERLAEMLAGVEQELVVSGHTHMQLDRRVGGVRFVNAGSVGMPYEGEIAAFWAAVVDGRDVEFRKTAFDVERARAEIVDTGWPEAQEFVRENLVEAVTRQVALDVFEPLT